MPVHKFVNADTPGSECKRETRCSKREKTPWANRASQISGCEKQQKNEMPPGEHLGKTAHAALANLASIPNAAVIHAAVDGGS